MSDDIKSGTSSARQAKKYGTNASKIDRARFVVKYGSDELKADLRSGRIKTIQAAWEKVKGKRRPKCKPGVGHYNEGATECENCMKLKKCKSKTVVIIHTSAGFGQTDNIRPTPFLLFKPECFGEYDGDKNSCRDDCSIATECFFETIPDRRCFGKHPGDEGIHRDCLPCPDENDCAQKTPVATGWPTHAATGKGLKRCFGHHPRLIFDAADESCDCLDQTECYAETHRIPSNTDPDIESEILQGAIDENREEIHEQSEPVRVESADDDEIDSSKERKPFSSEVKPDDWMLDAIGDLSADELKTATWIMVGEGVPPDDTNGRLIMKPGVERPGNETPFQKQRRLNRERVAASNLIAAEAASEASRLAGANA